MAKEADINNGHIDIAHDIAEALMRINLSSYQYRIMWCIIRKTWGWHKSKDKISLTQFEIMTGLERRHINKALKDLKDKNIIVIDRNNYINIYKFNSHYNTWKVKTSADIGTSADISTKVVPIQAPELVPIEAHTEEKKETIQKKEIIDIFDYWNKKEIITHRKLDQATKGGINAKLEDYSLEEIKQAIHNYSVIQKNEDELYYWDHKWTLKDFMQRGFEKFKDKDIAHDNYLKNEFRKDKLK